MDDVSSTQTGGAKVRSLDAETAVIGSLMIDADNVAGIVFHRLRPEDFGNPERRTIFKAAQKIWLEQRPLDPVTVLAEAGKDYEQLVTSCMMVTPTATNIEAYAEIVATEAQLRKLRDVGMRMTMHCDDMETAKKLLSEAEGLLSSQRQDRSRTYREMLDDFLARQNDTKPLDYIDWGIDELNRNVKISQGRFVIIGAQSSVGKTALALQLAYNIGKSGKRVGFFSYETSLEDAEDRLFANTAGVDMARTKTKNLNYMDIEELIREGDYADRVNLTVEDSGSWTIDDLRAITLAKRYEVIFIDYVQIIPGDLRKPRWEVVTETSMALHRMAQNLGVTVIALSQVTAPEKDSKGRRRALTKEDLREAQQLGNDAEAVLLMDLTVLGNYDSERELRIDKNKDGGRGKIYLKFDPAHMRFTPCEKPEHLKKKEFREEMARVAKENREQRKAELTQMGFEDLGRGMGSEIPF